jgi:lipopolysaccharide biosynthesis regulator YciM
VRSHLVHALVQLDRDYTEAGPADRWEDWYAARLGAMLEL